MDREIVIDVLLLVTLTWLLFKLTVMLEPPPPGDQSAVDKSREGEPTHR